MNLPRVCPKEVNDLLVRHSNISFLVKDFEEIELIVNKLYPLSTAKYYVDDYKEVLLKKYKDNLTTFINLDEIYLDVNQSIYENTFVFSSKLWDYTSYPTFKFNNYSEIKYLI